MGSQSAMKIPGERNRADSNTGRLQRRSGLKRLYLHACALVARADGVVAREELATIGRGLRSIGLLDAEDDLEVLLGEAVDDVGGLDLQLPESQWERESLASVLLAVATCDGHCDDRERAIIEKIAERIGVSVKRIAELAAIVEGATKS